MKGLRRLYVEFDAPMVWRGIWGSEGNERGLLESLRGVEAERFVVGFPWEQAEMNWVREESVQREVGLGREREIEVVRVNGKSEGVWPKNDSRLGYCGSEEERTVATLVVRDLGRVY